MPRATMPSTSAIVVTSGGSATTMVASASAIHARLAAWVKSVSAQVAKSASDGVAFGTERAGLAAP